MNLIDTDGFQASARPVPPFRRDGAYALLVFLHAKTLMRAGLAEGGMPDTDRVSEALRIASETLEGMARYQSHPFRRHAPEPVVAWRRGSVRMLDFGGEGPPILMIPSMVNGSQIMDLLPERSPLRWLSRQGFRVFQIDWGRPGKDELGFDLGDFLDHRLIPALGAAARLGGAKPHLLGYCMGGPLMLALAQRAADQSARIITLGAPWDFTAFPEHQNMRETRAQVAQAIDGMGLIFGMIPSQMTQSFFALRDLESGGAKFRRFAQRPILCPRPSCSPLLKIG